MSQAAEILTELQRRGVIVAVEGDTLCLKPRRALDDTLLARVREVKPATCGSPLCAGCYVVDAETGAKIHPPKCGSDYFAWLKKWEPKGKVQ